MINNSIKKAFCVLKLEGTRPVTLLRFLSVGICQIKVPIPPLPLSLLELSSAKEELYNRVKLPITLTEKYKNCYFYNLLLLL